MRILLINLIALTVLASCKKMDLDGLSGIKPNSLVGGVQCLNSEKFSDITPYRTLKFFDGFDDAIPGDSCYTKQPKCDVVLEWFDGRECPFTYSAASYPGLKNLNKCVWKVWNGYNFWSGDSIYLPENIDVSGGHLNLKLTKNPNYNPSLGTCGDKSGDNAPFSANMNCKYASAGLDSRWVDSETPGRSALYGRIEMKARYIGSTGYPALWMWTNTIGEGYPHVASSANVNGTGPQIIGEIDILEANTPKSTDYMFQSYHNWDTRDWIKGSSYSSQGRLIGLNKFHTYGVEWSPEKNGEPAKIRFYMDECVTHEIKEGDQNNAGRSGPMTISDVASFMTR